MRIIKKCYLLFIIFFLILLPTNVKAGINDVQSMEVEVNQDGTIDFLGTTLSGTDNMNVLIKIFDGKNLEYFNQVVVYNNEIKFRATPKDAQFGTNLKLVITGDLTYNGTFYYHPDYDSFIEEVTDSSFDLLQKYAIYYDDTIATKLKFDVDYTFNGKLSFVYLKGNNFVEKDNAWQNKDAYSWDIYLQTITTKIYELSKGEDVYIYVYDKNGKLLQAFPDEANDALKDPTEDKPGSGSGEGGSTGGEEGGGTSGGDGDSSGGNSGEGESSTNKNIITNDILLDLLKNNKSYSDGKYKYGFTYYLKDATETLIDVKVVANFSKWDDCWTNVNTTKLEAFFDTLALKINAKYNADIDFVIYDKYNNVLTSYNYYTYTISIGGTVPGEDSQTSSSSSQTSSSSTTTESSSVDEDYVPDDDKTGNDEVDIPPFYELDPDYQFVPWNDKRATGLVLALYLADYGYNSGSLRPICEEQTTDGYYVHEMKLDETNVNDVLSTLRHDSKKILFVKEQTDSNNVNLTINSNIVEKLKSEKVRFILDTDYYKVELDFAKFTGSGDVVINTSDVSMSSDDYAKPLMLTVKVNGSDATNYFSEPIKCLIHYDSEKTRLINDLRSINVFNSRGIMFNSTSTTLEKGFVFRYSGGDTYFVKNNQYVFTDIDEVFTKRAAELSASKGIIDGYNGGNFYPEKIITRGEFIYYLANKLGAFSNDQHFANLEYGDPYFSAVNGIYELGIMPTHFRKNLDINKNITREEMIYMIVRCYEVNNNNKSTTSASLLYRDKADISAWAKAKVGIASRLEIIDDDGYLYPGDEGTKGFAAELFYNLLVAEGIF